MTDFPTPPLKTIQDAWATQIFNRNALFATLQADHDTNSNSYHDTTGVPLYPPGIDFVQSTDEEADLDFS